jgi:hypothetical protein
LSFELIIIILPCGVEISKEEWALPIILSCIQIIVKKNDKITSGCNGQGILVKASLVLVTEIDILIYEMKYTM